MTHKAYVTPKLQNLMIIYCLTRTALLWPQLASDNYKNYYQMVQVFCQFMISIKFKKFHHVLSKDHYIIDFTLELKILISLIIDFS